MNAAMQNAIEITRLTKDGGPLTKHISLTEEGELHSDGSACVMTKGLAQRVSFPAHTVMPGFAKLIAELDSNEAIALGTLPPELSEIVKVTTKTNLKKLNGSAPDGLIARTADSIRYRPGVPALALIDFDTKGMPESVKAEIEKVGGAWAALQHVIPALGNAGYVLRHSTSAGISRTDTGEAVKGSNGVHIYLLVKDGGDVERFLRTLHDRCWLKGFGWRMVGAGGQLLDRSIVDRMVFAGERLVFEGAPTMAPGLVQAPRPPEISEGVPLDSAQACPPLTVVEKSRLEELRQKEGHRLEPERAKVREAFIAKRAGTIAAERKISPAAARSVAERITEGVLLPDVGLSFDDPDLDGCTVADVLRDPAQFDGETLADPTEGVAYGTCKAKIMRRADGRPFINSFAHGHTAYELQQDVAGIEEILDGTPKELRADKFIELAASAELADHDQERLRDKVSADTKTGKRILTKGVQKAKKALAERQREEQRQREAAERCDTRPRLPAPAPDAPWLPQMDILNEVLAAAKGTEPPVRDVRGNFAQVRVRAHPQMHALTSVSANEGSPDDTSLPAPEQPLLTALDEIQLSEVIERHIEHVDPTGRAVHLGMPFVKHYLVRHDGALPVVSAVATLPMVLADGTMLSGEGLDRERGVVFRIPPQLQALVPKVEECTPIAVAEAMSFLCDEWLCDVATDYAGKAVLIAATASILERLVLPERPAFFISAGQRGGGKTTAASMVSVAALGVRASAAAWSTNVEERRKALLAYLTDAVPLICWDNIPRGSHVSCPAIEMSLTLPTFTDRVLGVNENRTVNSTSIHIFTGNNITGGGDMASRSMNARLTVDRADPENRAFKHADPIGWTLAHRGKILRCIYTILLGNPRLRDKSPPQAETRFKEWWHLVGSAVENAASQHVAFVVMGGEPTSAPRNIAFRTMILAGESQDEQTSSLATVLTLLRSRWPKLFQAADVAAYVGNAGDDQAVELKSAIEQATKKQLKMMTSTEITWALKSFMEAPVVTDEGTLILKYEPSTKKTGGTFSVKVTSAAA